MASEQHQVTRPLTFEERFPAATNDTSSNDYVKARKWTTGFPTLHELLHRIGGASNALDDDLTVEWGQIINFLFTSLLFSITS